MRRAGFSHLYPNLRQLNVTVEENNARIYLKISQNEEIGELSDFDVFCSDMGHRSLRLEVMTLAEK